MSDYKKLSEEKQKSSEIEYISSRLSSVMETYKRLMARKCV